MMAHAIDNPAPMTIVLISGDRDFVYAVSILSLRRYRVILLAPRAAYGGLKAQASAVYNWPDAFLPELPPSAPHCHGSQANALGSSHPQNFSKGGPVPLDRRWSPAATSPAYSITVLEPSMDGDTLGSPDDYAESRMPVPEVRSSSDGEDISDLEQLEEPDENPGSTADGDMDSQESSVVGQFKT